MSDYRLVWSDTGDTIGYIHNIGNVVVGAELTFFFDQTSSVVSEVNTPKVSLVEI
jgi:hypothetical protein